MAHPIVDLQSPQSFIVDPSTRGYFIANANGEPGDRDNNGYISKLDAEGEVTDAHFIQGGKDGAVLHSPYGMTIVKGTLYVADLETVKGFHIKSGKSVVTVSLARHGVTELSGLTSDSHGILYVADTEGNTIYRISPQEDFSVSEFVHKDQLAGPRGLAIHPRSGHLIVASLNDGTVLEVAPKGSIREIVSNGFFTARFHNLSGVDFDKYGNMYVSDITAGKVWRIQADFRMDVIAEFLISPSSLSVDRTKHLILIPYLYANGAEMNGLERPSNVRGEKRKRTLADYGLEGLEDKSKNE